MGSVVVYTRPGCLFCQQVQRMLKDAGILHRSVHVSDVAAQNEFIAKAGAKSFPLVFVDGEYVGGFTHIVHLHSQGRLEQLVPSGAEPAAPAAPVADELRPNSFMNMAKDEIAGFAAWGEFRKRSKSG